jgi:hypothetical protein
MGVWKSNAIVYYQITRLSEQKCTRLVLAIPFAENNIGPFKHIAFIIVLFESPSKTLFRVLFASLYLQICMFYHGVLFLVRLWARGSKWANPTGNTTKKYIKTMRCFWLQKARALFMYEMYISTTSRERTHVYGKGRENILAIYLSRHIPDKI